MIINASHGGLTMQLLSIEKGQTVQIKDLSNISSLTKHRLLQLGVCEGCSVTIRQVLPLGGPCVLECQGQTFGIRQADAKQIVVENV